MPETIRCELVSWSRVHHLAGRLAARIIASGFCPDVVVAIARGGFVPARLLCDFLDIADLESFRVQHYMAGWQKQQRARLLSTLNIDVRGKRVLVVDDVTDTGDTLEVMDDYLRTLGCAEYRVAVLHHKQSSGTVPDYYGQKVTAWRWLTYPWAVVEDLGGFVKKLADVPSTPAALAQRLHAELGIRVPAALMKEIHAFVIRT